MFKMSRNMSEAELSKLAREEVKDCQSVVEAENRTRVCIKLFFSNSLMFGALSSCAIKGCSLVS